MQEAPKPKMKVAVLGIIGVALILVIAVLAVVLKNPYGDLEPFPVRGYIDSPENYGGNSYLLEVRIESQLSHDEQVGRIFKVRPIEASAPLAVFVSNDHHTNIHVGQRYRMEVRVTGKGLINVESLTKF